MKRYFEDLGSYVLIGIVAIGVLIMYAVSRTSTFNWTFFSIGFLLTMIPIIGYFIVNRFIGKQDETNYNKYLQKLKREGDRIHVNLSECIVKSNNWSYEKDKYNDPRIQFLNGISGHSDKNTEIVNVNNSVLLYKANYKGRNRNFKSGTIQKDGTTLKMLLEMQKSTDIIVDPVNPKYYYFDLEFLDS